MISALAEHARERQAAGDRLRDVIRSGSTPECSIANILPVRPKPVCTSSATSTIPCSSQIAAHALHELAAARR